MPGWRRRFGVAAAALALSGCAGSSPRGQLDHGVYRAREGFRVTVPGPDWEATTSGRAHLELRQRATAVGIFANVECGPEAAKRDLAVLTRRLFVGLRARAAVENGAATIAGIPAAHAVMEVPVGDDGERVRLEAYVVKDERCVYDLVYVAPAATFAERRADFQRFVESFTRE
jgi:hypothetical protein